MSQGTIGYGSQFFIGTIASPLGYQAILEQAEVEIDDYSVPEIKVTHLLSPSRAEEKIPGIINAGKISVTGNFVGDTTQQNVDLLAFAGTIIPWKFTGPAGTKTLTMTGVGFISNMKKGPFGVDKKTDIKFDVTISGIITYAYA
jgi:hypothetical protein